MQKYGTPYIGGAFCTDRMKEKPFVSWCMKNFKAVKYKVWLPARIDQPSKFDKVNPRKFLYLADISDYEISDITYFWKQQPFRLDLPSHLGNCVFCIKKSFPKIGLATKDEPKMATEFINLIEQAPNRKRDKSFPNDLMYRNRSSLRAIKAFYNDIDKKRYFKKNELFL